MSAPATPLRYPGGKQKIWHFIAEIIEANDLVGCDYVEPYAGGAGVAVELLLSEMVSKIHLNDNDPAVYSFWYSIINYTDEFCRKVGNASLTLKEWERQKAIYKVADSSDLLSLGFSLFYLNRCNRSGILSAGVIGGKSQCGKWKIDARFNRNNLIHRIERIALKKKFIKVKKLDAEVFIDRYVNKLRNTSFIYCDPPYYSRADRLYKNIYSPEDHVRIADTINNKINGHWVVSYDNAPEIVNLYSSRRCFSYSLQYNAARVYKGKELFVFCDSLVLPLKSKNSEINQALETIV